jgi:FtsZ-interacting cell division protein YlmF
LDGAYTSRHQAVIYHLTNFEQCREVILSLLDRKSALVNLDQLGDVDVQRAVDTLGGAAFALGATISKASDRTYLITPSNVTVAGGGIERASGPRRYF